MSKKELGLLTVVFLLAFIVRFFPYGNNLTSSNDNQLVTHTLSLAQHFSEQDYSYFFEPSKYPLVFSYVLLLALVAWYAIGFLVGAFQSPGDFSTHLLLNPEQLYVVSNFLMALFGATTVVVLYLVLKKLLGSENANRKLVWLGTVYLAFSLLHVQYSHQPRPHVAGAFFLLLSFYVFLKYLENPGYKMACLLGLVTGASFGSIQSALVGAVFIPAMLFSSTTASAGSQNKPSLLKNFFASAAIFIVVSLLSYPHLITSPQKSISADQGIDFTLSGHTTPSFPVDASRFLPSLKQFVLYEPAMVFLLAALAILLFWRIGILKKTFSRAPRALALLICVFYFFGLSLVNSATPRWYVPVIPFAVIVFVLLWEAVLAWLADSKKTSVIMVLLLLPIFISVVQTGRFLTVLGEPNSKVLASRWVVSNIAKDETAAFCCEWFFEVRPTLASIQRHLSLNPESVSNKDKLTFDKKIELEDSRDVFKYWQLVPKGEPIAEVVGTQNLHYFVFALSSPRITRSEEYEFIKENSSLVATFDPRRSENGVNVYDFPDDFRNPFLELWSADRFGPPIEVYRLNAQ